MAAADDERMNRNETTKSPNEGEEDETYTKRRLKREISNERNTLSHRDSFKWSVYARSARANAPTF